jgi:hypothetical protein
MHLVAPAGKESQMGYLTARLLAALLGAHFISTTLFPPADDEERESPFSLKQSLERGISAGILSYVLVGDWLLWQIPAAVSVVHLGVGHVLSKSRRSSVRRFARYHVLPLVVVGALAFALSQSAGVDFFWGKVFGPPVFHVYAFVAGLIGTLMSVGLALALSYATRFLMASLGPFSSPTTFGSLTLAQVM